MNIMEAIQWKGESDTSKGFASKKINSNVFRKYLQIYNLHIIISISANVSKRKS